MAIAGLVLGILSITVFWWLGFAIGGLWTAGASLSTFLTGGAVEIATWRVWILGLGLGVGVPIVAIVMGIGGMSKGQKGIGLTGVITGAVGAILGLIVAAFLAIFAPAVTEAAKDQAEAIIPAEEMEKMKETLDDPAFQEQMLKAMQAAADQAAAAKGTAEKAPEDTGAQ